MKNAPVALLPWLLLAAAPALAVNGVLEVNQTCAGVGCFAGDTAGFPVLITAPGSYVLTSDLEVPGANSTAITVITEPVSIDLNGFSIRGVTTCAGLPTSGDFACTNTGNGRGITAVGRSLTVRNGRITGMGQQGILAGHQSLVEDVHLSHNGERAISVGRASIVRGNTIRVNGGTAVGEETIAGVSASIASLIIDNSIEAVGGIGIDASDSRVVGNVLSNVLGDAVALTNGIMVGNHVAQATGLGLRAAQTTGIGGNVFRANNGFGTQFCDGVEISTNVGSRTATCP